MVKVLEEFRPGRINVNNMIVESKENITVRIKNMKTYKRETKEKFYGTHYCSCDGKCSLHHQKRHEGSKKHQNYLNAINLSAA